MKCGEDHLVLCPRGESLVMIRQPHVGVQGAAAHCGIKLAVSYHGAVPTLSRQPGKHWVPHRQERKRWGKTEGCLEGQEDHSSQSV